MAADKEKKYFIAVAGVIGSGKTTVSNYLAKELGFRLFEENVAENSFLPLFYKDPKRWAFHTQLFYLKEKLHQLVAIKESLVKTGVVQDAPLHQDHYTYAKAQHLLGNISNDEFSLYEKFFHSFRKDLPQPDLILQLEASPSVLAERIKKRGREYEVGIERDYIELLSDLQRQWIKEYSHLNIHIVRTNDLDLVENMDHRKKFLAEVKNSLI